MDVFITPGRLEFVDFAPANVYAEIIQNVQTIISTTKWSVPLDRDFGVDATFVDKPMSEAQALISSEIVDALRTYEPRVTLSQITWEGNIDGELVPKVQVRIDADQLG